MTHRVWFKHYNKYVWCGNDLVDHGVISRRPQPTDASAAGGSWRTDSEQPLVISFAPSWCQRVTMRDCVKMKFPDGTVEVQSNNVEVIW